MIWIYVIHCQSEDSHVHRHLPLSFYVDCWPRTVIISWARSALCMKHMSLWYPFLEPYLTTSHSKIGVHLKIGHVYLKCWVQSSFTRQAFGACQSTKQKTWEAKWWEWGRCAKFGHFSWSNTYIWVVCGLVGLQEQRTKGRRVFKRGWIAFSKYDNHLRFNCHDNILFLIFISFYFLGGRPLNEHENIHFDNE